MVLALATGIGPLLIVLAVVVIVFGPKRIPALARQLGSGLREFRKSVGGDDDDDREQLAGGERGPQQHRASTDATASEDASQHPPRG